MEILLGGALVLCLLLLILAVYRLSPRRGLKGQYYANDSWSGPPVTTAVDRVIRFDKSQIARRVKNPVQSSVSWQGYIFAPRSATYDLAITSDDGSWVYLDGQLKIDNGGVHPKKTAEKEIFLSRGNHAIKIQYFDRAGSGYVAFRFRMGGFLRVLSPRLPLYPEQIALAVFVWDMALSCLKFVLGAALLAAAFLFFVALSRRAAEGLNSIVRKLGTIEQKVLFPKFKKFFFFSSIVFFLVLVGLYEAEIFSKRSTSVRGCDSYAYLQGADLMARRGVFHTEYYDPVIPQIYQGYQDRPPADSLKFFLSPHGHYVFDLNQGLVYSVFPPGISLLIFPFIRLCGRSAAFLVLPFLNLFLLLLFFYLGSRLVHVYFGLCFCAMVFFNAQVFENTVYIMSDAPSMALLAASAFLLYRNRAAPNILRPLVAGACFGFSLVVRYSNVVGIVPLAYLLWAKFGAARRWRVLVRNHLSFGLGTALLGFLPLALYTHHLFGTVFRLVYEPITQSRVQLLNFRPGIDFYLKGTYRTFGVGGIILILIGAAACLVRRKKRSLVLVAALAYVSFLIFYSFQSIQHDRYLMPVYPFLAVLVGVGAMAIIKKFDQSLLVKFLIILFCTGYPFFSAKDKYAQGIVQQDTNSLAVREKIEAHSVVFCDDLSGPLRLYAGIPGYRFTWTEPRVLKNTLSVLDEKKYAVYFLMDSPAARGQFSFLLNNGYIAREGLEFVAQIGGFDLYRVRMRSP